MSAKIQREDWIDVLKGLAIILVVLGHVLDGATGQSLFADDGWMVKLHEAIYIFHMPLFFLLSGAAFAIYTDPGRDKVDRGGMPGSVPISCSCMFSGRRSCITRNGSFRQRRRKFWRNRFYGACCSRRLTLTGI